MRRWLLVALVVLGACGGADEGASAPTVTTVDSASTNEVLTVAVRAAAARLPLVDITTSTAADDPNGLLGQPRQYVARVAWRDRRVRPERRPGETIGVETGGSLERFASAADLQDRKQTLEATLGLLISSEVLFAHGLVLLRLPSTLSEQDAAEVDRVLLDGLGAAGAPVTTATTAPVTTRGRGRRP